MMTTPRRYHAGFHALLAATSLACALSATGAHADEREDLQQLRTTTLALIQALVEGGLLSREKADALIRQSQQTPSPGLASASGSGERRPVIRVPYVPETVKKEMREEIRQDVLAQARAERWGEPGALPDWVHRLNLEGDVRFRLQHEDWDKNNLLPTGGTTFGYLDQFESPAWSPDLANTTNSRDRLTLRARFGISGDLGFGLNAGMRLSTGNFGPVSTSQTLSGGDGNFSKYNVLLDRAYVKWQAFVPDVTLMAGRFANPFFGGDLAWPDDLNFDGLAGNVKHRVTDHSHVFATAGVFPLQEFESSGNDKWLYGLQFGGSFNAAPDTTVSLGLGFFDFKRVEGVADERFADQVLAGTPYLTSAYPRSVRQKGNTLLRLNPFTQSDLSTGVAPVWGLASKFRPITFSGAVSFNPSGALSVKGSLDVIKNTGFNLEDIRRRAALPDLQLQEKTTGLQARLHIGSPKQELRGDWSAFLAWRRFERDAWLDGFTDTTWHLGGTNYSGWSLGGAYYVGPRTSMGLRVTSTRNLKDGAMLNNPFGGTEPNVSSAPLKIDVIQLELNSRF